MSSAGGQIRRASPRKRSLSSSKVSTKRTTTKAGATTSLSKSSDDNNILDQWICHSDAHFHHFPPDEAAEIRLALLKWYRSNRRKLPWRGDPPPFDGSTAATSNNKKNNGTDYNQHAKQIPQSAYGVWVSEIMLQQTRVEAVIPYWLKWMETFPTIQDLANATEEQVNSHWAGLGFYRRARLLHQAAQYVVEKYPEGKLPESVEELLQIPGIGPYTANAIASIAFDKSVPVVDGNVCRVLSRLRGIANHIKAPILKDKLGWELARQIVTAGDGLHAGEVNQALMEIGATYCAPSGTGVEPGDPLKDYYMSTKLGVAFYERILQQQNMSVQDLIQQSIQSKNHKKQSTTKGTSCPLCHEGGISNVLEQLETLLEEQQVAKTNDSDSIEAARRCGHSAFPIAPPKQTKREEVLAMAVISTAEDNGDDAGPYWLLVKRPKKGLLAGQWEFPSTCVWSSDNEGKSDSNKKSKGVKGSSKAMKTEIEVPSISSSARRKAVDTLLSGILETDNTILNTKMSSLKGSPLEHIFSHVRHTMYIEYANLHDVEPSEDPWIATSGRECRWMRSKDMAEAGVTSGVKKVLKAVAEEQKKTQKKQAFFQPRKRKK